jgi:hypothetical protein
MQPKIARSILALTAAIVIATLWGARQSAVGQTPTTYKAPLTADGHPDLNGFWQALNTANWDLEEHGAKPAPFQNLVGAYLAQPAGLSVVEGGTIPYKPEALAQRDQNFQTRLSPDPFNRAVSDPEAKCFGPAPPRGAYLPLPFQIIQSKSAILFAYEFAVSPRIIQMGEVDPLVFFGIDTWMGQSRGRWEGDTLVVEAQGFAGKVWLDRGGNFMTEAAKVTERYTPISPYHLRYEATIEDPNVFTRPWKMSMPLYRRIDPNMQLLEFQCIPFMEEYLYGKLKKPGSK